MQSVGMRQQIGTGGTVRSRAAAAVTGATLRPLTFALPANRTGVLVGRHLAANSLRLLGPALPGSGITRVVGRARETGAVRGEWVRGPSAERDDAVIFYVHGSAYTICSSRTHRGVTTRLSELTGLPAFACDYRLAPRHRFPTAADDVRAAYAWLLDQGYAPERVVFAGDSAGGHLAVDLTTQILREGGTPPAALVLFSPVVDLSMGLARERERMRPDPMISAERAARLVRLYLADTDLDADGVRLRLDGLGSFPPTLIHAGGREMLAADAIELERMVSAIGGETELRIWPDQMHVFQALPRVAPEAGRALGQASRFILTRLEAGRARPVMTLVKEA